MTIDIYIAAFVFAGALLAGFTTGLAGFGTGLVAAGFWFHVLPAGLVPPLIALASIAGQATGLLAVRRRFNWPRATPFLLGGILGVPFGVWALAVISPDALRLCVGIFLMVYASTQLTGILDHMKKVPKHRLGDAIIGTSGGFLGGLAGLSGTPPLIWLQLQGGESGEQRAIYQPFNMIVLSVSATLMWAGGQFPPGTWTMTAWALPGTIIGAWIGARLSTRISERHFRFCVLALLLGSGMILIWRAFGAA